MELYSTPQYVTWRGTTNTVEWLTSCFVFGRSQAQISVRRPSIVTEVFRGFSSVYPGHFQDITLKLDHNRASFSILSNSALAYHPFIRGYIVQVSEK
jgi:hypothetical protein